LAAAATGVLLAPLCFAPQRLWHPSPWLLVLSALAVYLSQPTPPARDLRSAADRGTARFIILGGNLATVVPMVEYAARTAWQPAALSGWVIFGAVLLSAGATLRIWAVQTLGPFFTATVEVEAGHRLVVTGPYRLVRHPSYLGVMLMFIGEGLALESVSAPLLTFGVMLPIYLRRIRVEEAALERVLGDPYVRYRREVALWWPRLIRVGR
jgi:protein-S-isoprenylcysteine O-methyltransferase Ste14